MLLNYRPSLEILSKKICSKIGEQVSVGLTPVQIFLDFWTDDHTHPGDKLAAKLLELETNVMELLSLSSDSHNQSTQAGLPVDDPFSIGLSRQLRGSPRRVTQSSTAPTREFQVTSEHYSLIELTNAVKVLQEDVARLKEEIGDQPLMIGGVGIQSVVSPVDLIERA
jgi:hypothetical protein